MIKTHTLTARRGRLAMTRREAERLTHQENVLLDLGFTRAEAESLRRISMTLHRWYEHERNGAIQREGENGDGRPFWYNTDSGRKIGPVADREAGAVKRLKAIIDRRNRDEVRQTTCSVCDLDIEGSFPFQTWHDRGGNEHGSNGHDQWTRAPASRISATYTVSSASRPASIHTPRTNR